MKQGVTLIFHICLVFFQDVESQNQEPTAKSISTCTPPPKSGAEQYIVGYGSLMSAQSKHRTYPDTLDNFPVTVKGFARTWNCRGVSPTLSTTYLGVYKNPNASFNAALFKLSNGSLRDAEKALMDFDKRESFYCRHELIMGTELKLLSNFSETFVEESRHKSSAQYWIYVTKPEYTAPPTVSYPLVQSYVDTWLTGCFELEEKYGLVNFSKDCVQSTEGWSCYWVNDRIYPRRPFLFQPMAAKIDKLLKETVPDEFNEMNKNVGNNISISIWIVLACSMFYVL